MRKLEVYRVMLEIHPRAPGGPGDPGWMGKTERNTPRGAEPRGKTRSVFETNIWTISRLCLN